MIRSRFLTALGALCLLAFINPAAAQSSCASWSTLTGDTYLDGTATAGACYDLENTSDVYLPDPSVLPVGDHYFRKSNDGAGFGSIRRADGSQFSGGWTLYPLPLQGDWVRINNDGSEYRIIGQGAGAPVGLYHGQHRTLAHSTRAEYNTHPGDRGAVLRMYPDTGNINVYLTSPADLGWAAGGYRSGWNVCVMNAYGTTNGNQIWIWTQWPDGSGGYEGHPLRGHPHANGQFFVVIATASEHICFDFDGAEWHVTDHFKPSGSVDYP